ncbi:MAG TPA: lysylphosphatidylglycerol synthase transmembrane domain-containing protein [Candidatus Methylomirabilis sp.]|nr:lysylphosphatidylglycerol synthase transmembrane domain-containing protein [Candidatus Methylomirabilis sp.]
MSTPARLAKILIGIAVSVALLAYLFWNVDLHEVVSRLASTNWWFLSVSILLNLGSLWIRAWRWYYLFPPGSHPSHLFNALMIGYLGNNVLPLRAGEVVRAYVASRRGQRFWTVLATIVVERALDGLAVGVIVAILVLTIPLPQQLHWPAGIFLALDFGAMITLAVLAVAPGWCSNVIHAFFHRWSWGERRAMDVLGTMSEGLRGVRAAHHFVPITLSTILIWMLFALSVWTGLRAAHLDLPLAASWTVLAFLGLGVSLPSSPGYLGVVQAATVLALALFSVPRTEALSFSLLIHASQFLPVTIYGLVLLLVEHVSLSEATRTTGAPVASSQR